MNDSGETARVVADVPKELKEAAKQQLEYGGITDVVEDALERTVCGGAFDRRSQLETRLESLETELRELRRQRREVTADIESVEDEISGVKRRLAEISDQEERFADRLESLETMLRHEGVRVYEGSKLVTEAAGIGDVSPSEVVETLMQRNPDVPDYAFEDGLHDQRTWHGLPDDEADTPVDEREAIER